MFLAVGLQLHLWVSCVRSDVCLFGTSVVGIGSHDEGWEVSSGCKAVRGRKQGRSYSGKWRGPLVTVALVS